MIRILIFLLSVILFAGAITYFASLDSRIAGEAFGVKFDAHSGLIIGGLFTAFLVVIYLTHAIKNLMAMPAKLKAREREARRARGVAALTRGLEAVAVGDASGAAHHAKVACSHLDDVALTRLLTAQSAHISGDETAARESFSAMLEAPETEFLGLKGLYHQAIAKGDLQGARDYAERAFRLRPNANWAFESVFELGLERGAWRETRDALTQARKNNLIATDKADRATAVLLTADAYAALLAGDEKLAVVELQNALKLAPGFSPAAALVARLYADEGKPGKAAKVIETAFSVAGHPALIKIFDRLYKDEAPEKRAERLVKLGEKNSQSREATLLAARADNLRSEWAAAIEKLEPLLTQKPTAAEFSLMATAITGLRGADAARPWLERAANAPRDPRPGADGEFHFTRQGWAQLVREYMEHARLAPPPLEEAALRMSAEEIRLLIAPPIAESVLEEDSESLGGAGADIESADAKQPAHADENGEDHIHNDEEAERAAAAAREVS